MDKSPGMAAPNGRATDTGTPADFLREFVSFAPSDKNAFDLSGRRALITGSTRGIGFSIAMAFARAGAAVVMHGVRETDNSQSAVDEVRAAGTGDVEFLAGDLAASGGGRALATGVLQRSGCIDIAVLNASVQFRTPWQEIETPEAELQIRCNFLSSLEIIQVLVPAMQEQRWGRILTVGSVQQKRPHPEMMVYAATKCAQMSLVTSLAKRLAPDGITVNNPAPGVFPTDRNNEALADAAYAAKVLDAIPCHDFGAPEDCASASLLLCSQAGRYITGQNLFVDGGLALC